MNLHAYTAGHQAATRFCDVTAGHIMWFRSPRNRLHRTWCCRKNRPAKNLTVQVFYDSIRFWCRAGKGCKR